MKKYIVSILFLFLSSFIFCQEREARILFLDSTSIKGFGEIKKEKIYFRVDQDSEITIWDFEMAKGLLFEGYGFSEEYEYVKTSEKSKPVLMEVMERGNVNLYRDASYGLKFDLKPSFTTNPSVVVNSSNGFGVNANNLNRGTENPYKYDQVFYIKRSNETIATDLSKNFKKEAIAYFSDCKTLVEKIEKKEFRKTEIPDIVFYYNDYCDSEWKE